MKQDDNIELPLYNAFMQLMKLEKNQPNKGIDPESYLQLIDVLHRGYALNSLDELLFFCKKLWLKPFHKGTDATITEEVLENIIRQNLREYNMAIDKNAGKVAEPDLDIPQPEDTSINDDINPDDPDLLPESDTPPQEVPKEEPITSLDPLTTTKLVINIEESIANNNVGGQQDYSNYFNEKKFKFNYTYLTVSPRFIEQTIRSLRYKVKGTGKPVIDVEATIKDVGSKGFFDNWLLTEEEDYVTRWTLLFDREGSMVAFHALQDALANAAVKGTMKNEGDLFYFRNVARDFLYTNEHRTRSVPFAKIVNGPVRNIIIVSDAGAARGTFNEDRIKNTYTMMYHLRKHRVAWLNPMPKERWVNSSATIISEFVNMFEPGNDHSDDLGNIVRLFKSKIITPITL